MLISKQCTPCVSFSRLNSHLIELVLGSIFLPFLVQQLTHPTMTIWSLDGQMTQRAHLNTGILGTSHTWNQEFCSRYRIPGTSHTWNPASSFPHTTDYSCHTTDYNTLSRYPSCTATNTPVAPPTSPSPGHTTPTSTTPTSATEDGPVPHQPTPAPRRTRRRKQPSQPVKPPSLAEIYAQQSVEKTAFRVKDHWKEKDFEDSLTARAEAKEREQLQCDHERWVLKEQQNHQLITKMLHTGKNRD